MGPFLQFGGHIYILLAMDYVFEWIKPIFCTKNYAITNSKFLKENIFSHFEMPRVLISDEGSLFINYIIAKLLTKYNITYKIATT